MKKNRVGEVYNTNQGYKITIIEYFGSTNISVKFNDEEGTVRRGLSFKEIKDGKVSNPNRKSTLGIGYVGQGKYKPKTNNKMSPAYTTWDGMIRRCYDPKSSRYNSYKDVEICEEWHNFQNFAKWFEENKVDGWQIDKDLVGGDRRVYSPEVCRFIPPELNAIFKESSKSGTGLPRGVYPKDNKFQSSINKFGENIYLGLFNTVEEAHTTYIIAKTEYLKELAMKWKDIVPEEIYSALLNYDVNKFL